MINSLEIQAAICNIALCDASEINADQALFSSGIIDSISLMELVSYLEKRYQIKVGASELTLDHFDSLGRIVRFVSRKTTPA